MGCLVLEGEDLDLVADGGGCLAGYSLTIWIRETQLNLLRRLEGAGAANVKVQQVRGCGCRCKEMARPRQSETRGRVTLPRAA